MCGTYPLDDDVFPQRGYCGPASIRIRVQNIQKYIDAVSGPRSTAYDRLTLAHMAVSYYSLQVVSLQSIVTLKSLAEGILLKGTTSKNMRGMESCQRNKNKVSVIRSI